MKLPCSIVSEVFSGYSSTRQAWLGYCVYLSWENWLLKRIRHKLISMFSLQHSDCCNRKVAIAKEGPAEMRQCCSEPTSFSALTFMLSAPMSKGLNPGQLTKELYNHHRSPSPDPITSWRAPKGWTHPWITWHCRCEKSILCTRCAPGKLYYKRKWIGPTLIHSFGDLRSGPSTATGRTGDQRTSDLFLFSIMVSLLSFYPSRYSDCILPLTLYLKFVAEVRRLLKIVIIVESLLAKTSMTKKLL